MKVGKNIIICILFLSYISIHPKYNSHIADKQRDIFYEELKYFINMSPDLFIFKKKMIVRWLGKYKKEILSVFAPIKSYNDVDRFVLEVSLSLKKSFCCQKVEKVLLAVIEFVTLYKSDLDLVFKRLITSDLFSYEEFSKLNTPTEDKFNDVLSKYHTKVHTVLKRDFSLDFFNFLDSFDDLYSLKLWKCFI